MSTLSTVSPPPAPGFPRSWFIASAVLCAAFALPLVALGRFALHSDLYSHTILMPLVSGWLIWQRRDTLPRASRPRPLLAVLPALAGLGLLAAYAWSVRAGAVLTPEDRLAFTMSALVLGFVAITAAFLGREQLRAIRFPLAMLVFMVPLPTAALDVVETLLQHGSAACAAAMFWMAGTTVFHENLTFTLPGIALHVAPECSGIHSTLALLITSLVAGPMFLRSPWRRAVLALAVVPLALLRNGFRVFTLGELCVRVGPQMIDSDLHHRGGPIFFALSLIPLLAVLVWLRRTERPLPASPSSS